MFSWTSIVSVAKVSWLLQRGTRTVCMYMRWMDLELCTRDGCKTWPTKRGSWCKNWCTGELVHRAQSLPEFLDCWGRDWSFMKVEKRRRNGKTDNCSVDCLKPFYHVRCISSGKNKQETEQTRSNKSKGKWQAIIIMKRLKVWEDDVRETGRESHLSWCCWTSVKELFIFLYLLIVELPASKFLWELKIFVK